MAAYYNEMEPYAAEWLRNLIRAGLIAPGDVDDRSIRDVHPLDLLGYTQCHFFAGIGVWSYALRRAGWADDRPVWTGSCPCQPFSAAGKGEGTEDPRHLWPDWFRLIREHRPVAIFGEQVSAAIRHAWLDLVSADLEGAGYAIGSAVMGAHSVGAPHIRQRLYFVADAGCERGAGWGNIRDVGEAQAGNQGARGERKWLWDAPDDSGATGELADAEHAERRPLSRPEQDERDGANAGRPQAHGFVGTRGSVRGLEHTPSDGREQRRAKPGGRGATSGCGPHGVALGDTDHPGSQGRGVSGTASGRDGRGELVAGATGATNGFWSDADWLPCIDGKARPVEPGTFPLAHGAPARVGRLRAYGNAINAETAVEFIRAAIG